MNDYNGLRNSVVAWYLVVLMMVVAIPVFHLPSSVWWVVGVVAVMPIAIGIGMYFYSIL